MRVGSGFDAHRLAPRTPDDTGVLLAGVEADAGRSVLATSDGDVVAHAVCDALLGAAALGDLGELFPSDDPRWQRANSMTLLGHVVDHLAAEGYAPASIDVTVIAETIRVAPHRAQMRANLAAVLGVPEQSVSVKATTTDGMGYLGRDEGIAACAIAAISSASD